MGKTEIIAELNRLCASDRAEVRQWLNRQANEAESQLVNEKKSLHIRSPRLANRNDARHFIKRVMEIGNDAAI